MNDSKYIEIQWQNFGFLIPTNQSKKIYQTNQSINLFICIHTCSTDFEFPVVFFFAGGGVKLFSDTSSISALSINNSGSGSLAPRLLFPELPGFWPADCGFEYLSTCGIQRKSAS